MVRTEILTALDQKKRLIPVLLFGASMPRKEELPAALSELAVRNAIEIRDTHFDSDVADLINALSPSSSERVKRDRRRTATYAVAIAALALLLGAWLYPRVVLTSADARERIASLGGRYDASSFVAYAANGDAHLVDLFLRAGMDPNVWNGRGETAVSRAAGEGHLDVLKTLVRHGAHVDDGLAPAVSSKRQDVLDFLLTQHPTQDAVSGSLALAARGRDVRAVRALLGAGANVNYNKYGTALAEAAFYGAGDVIELLLANGADASIADTMSTANGEIALHYAIRGTDSSSFPLLLRATKNLNARDNDGATPLLVAILHEKPRLVGPLLDRGADPKIPRKDGMTPLMVAALYGVPGVIGPLVSHGADVNARDDNGQTALMYAVAAPGTAPRSAEIVKALLDNGADPTIRDRNGSSAATLAVSAHHPDLVGLLERRTSPPARRVP